MSVDAVTVLGLCLLCVCGAVPQGVPNCGTNVLDLVFLLDSSGSIPGTQWKTMRDFVVNILQRVEIGQNCTRVGLIKYSDHVTHVFYLNDYESRSDMILSLKNLRQDRFSTETGTALLDMRHEQFVQERGDRSSVANVALLITDGKSTMSAQTIMQADLAKSEGVRVSTPKRRVR